MELWTEGEKEKERKRKREREREREREAPKKRAAYRDPHKTQNTDTHTRR
jgi:hypothetical protein